jgi:Ca-activated chloride channel family protein
VVRPFLVLLAAGCLAQDPAPIRVNVRLVNVSLLVRNLTGALVSDLTKDDFEVLEDGAPQAISFFAHSTDLPLTLGLVVDASGSQAHFVKDHEHDLRTFLKNVLTDRDRAFLISFGNHLRLASNFSSSPDHLMDGLKNSDHKHASVEELGPQEQRILGTAFYDALYYSSTLKLSSPERSRKALIVFSDGEDNSSAHHMMDAIEAAQTENIPIFAVRYTEIRKGRLNARNKYGISVMERIARETGGTDFDAEKTDLKKAFQSIGEQLRSSYELAFYATNSANDGTFHKLVVRSKRPGTTVRTKTGYYARE